jgi:nuclear GTP-binding protein
LAPIELLLKRCNKEQLITRYKISVFDNADEFLTLVAKRCGKVKKNGIPDVKKAAQMILNDWNRFLHMKIIFLLNISRFFVGI